MFKFIILENFATYNIMWKGIADPARAYWISKATNTHSEYVIRIVFPLQQWLHIGTSILPYMYIARLVLFVIDKL